MWGLIELIPDHCLSIYFDCLLMYFIFFIFLIGCLCTCFHKNTEAFEDSINQSTALKCQIFQRSAWPTEQRVRI